MSGRVEWRSVSDIVRDLSVAQGGAGGGVPAAPYASQAVPAMERPPKLHIQEETEEEFYSEFVGGGESVGPDCTEIQELLSMVKVVEEVGACAGVGAGVSRRHRNAALESIKGLHERSPADMFRRKCDVTNVTHTHTTATDTVHKTVEVKTKESLPSKEYQPSAEALERANRYRESRRREEAAAEDVWTRAMRTMKERDQERTNRSGDEDARSPTGLKPLESVNNAIRGGGDRGDPPAC